MPRQGDPGRQPGRGQAAYHDLEEEQQAPSEGSSPGNGVSAAGMTIREHSSFPATWNADPVSEPLSCLLWEEGDDLALPANNLTSSLPDL